MDKNFKEIGVSVSGGKLEGKEGVLVVQMFGSGVSKSQLGENTINKQGKPVEASSQSQLAEDIDINQKQIVDQANNKLDGEVATVLASRQFSISKIVSLILVGFVFFLFVLEVAVAGKRQSLQIKSSTLAHLGILALTLFAVWYAVSGAVI